MTTANSLKDNSILLKALKKAVPFKWYDDLVTDVDTEPDGDIVILLNDKMWFNFDQPYQVIFSHGFAKAFWGEGYIWFRKAMGWKEKCEPDLLRQTSMKQDWQYHLEKMVLYENPFNYLKNFLKLKKCKKK